MARLALTVKDALGSYPSLPLAANAADLAFEEPAAFADGISFVPTGHEVLLVWNTTAGALTVTISSVADNRGRTGDITTYSIGADTVAVFGPFSKEGWAQADGSIYAVASAAGVKFTVVRW
jgi:hypothetical protein